MSKDIDSIIKEILQQNKDINGPSKILMLGLKGWTNLYKRF